MKIKFVFTIYIFFSLWGSAYGNEQLISLGSSASWNLIDYRQGIIEAPEIRPNSVLILDVANPLAGMDRNLIDVYLSFDDSRRFFDPLFNYNVNAALDIGFVNAPYSRIGEGAALFHGNNRGEQGALVLSPNRSALFAPGNHIGDFSIEFWLCPQNLENGEQIFTMLSSMPDGRSSYLDQHITLIASRNRLVWTFKNFFFHPQSALGSLDISLTGTPVLNRVWSHHLLRFDAELGILEYLIDGRVEALEYITDTGRERGQVYTPIVGENSRIILGTRYAGLIDEFKILRSYKENINLNIYQNNGRIESNTIDLGYFNSQVLMLEASGGRVQSSYAIGRTQNEFGGNNLSFSDFSEIRFFIRYSNHPYQWGEWIPVSPGTALSASHRGRYIQIAADFYPGMNGTAAPYLEEIRIIYRAQEAPPPPQMLSAVARDGAVELSWRPSPVRNLGGYLIYYGTSSGEYIYALPIDAGNTAFYRIEGLNNGTLYFFAVAAYYSYHIGEGDYIHLESGEFSRELAARPLPY